MRGKDIELDKNKITTAFGDIRKSNMLVVEILLNKKWNDTDKNEHWLEAKDEISKAYSLQKIVNNADEAQCIIEKIKNNFGGYDLGIQQTRHDNGNITLTIPSYVIHDLSGGTKGRKGATEATSREPSKILKFKKPDDITEHRQETLASLAPTPKSNSQLFKEKHQDILQKYKSEDKSNFENTEQESSPRPYIRNVNLLVGLP